MDLMAFQRVRSALHELEEDPAYIELVTPPIACPECSRFWRALNLATTRAMILDPNPANEPELRDRLRDLHVLAVGQLAPFSRYIDAAVAALDACQLPPHHARSDDPPIHP
jgi:hypothetical protein